MGVEITERLAENQVSEGWGAWPERLVAIRLQYFLLSFLRLPVRFGSLQKQKITGVNAAFEAG